MQQSAIVRAFTIRKNLIRNKNQEPRNNNQKSNKKCERYATYDSKGFIEKD